MLGSISLIAFLSVRNTYLAGRTRDLCKLLQESKQLFLQTSLSLQLYYFASRYWINNLALICAILSVLFFGIMIGMAIVLKYSMLDLRAEPSFIVLIVIALILGGMLAAVATAISIYETYIGRRSLFTHIACTIIDTIDTKLSESDEALCTNFQKIEGVIHRSLRKKDNDALKQRLNDAIKGLKEQPGTSQ